MAKKFFYNRVYNTRRTIINSIIIGVCIIGIIICFIITSNFQGESHENSNSNLSIKNEVTVEVNENFSNEIFFSKIENVDLNNIQINYDLNYDISKPGKYDITIIINGKNYSTVLNVVDTTKPELTLKNLKIDKGKSYSVSDFVEKCEDNSEKNCIITFFNGMDEDGNPVDYAKYKEEGTYAIKISAEDNSGNQVIKETTLTIGNSNSSITPIVCKYGNNKYDKENYLIAVDITTNNCAVSLDLYKDENMTNKINKLMETETIKIKKNIEDLNLKGTLALNRKVTAIINTSGSGIVGYELKMTVTNTNNGKSEIIAEYKIDENGKRIFITNPYKIAS